MENFKKKVQAIIHEKQLASTMNNTKWEMLQSGVLESLPFPPPFQCKYVLQERPEPECFDNDVSYWGDWIEGLFPFYSVEWIRVRPRYLKNKGRLVGEETVDISEEFRSLIQKLGIPYKEEENSFYIYGYVEKSDIFGDLLK